MKNFKTMARYALPALAIGAAIAAGCNSNPKQAGLPTNPSVTEISPLPPAQPQPAAAPIMPLYAQQPVTTVAMSAPAAQAAITSSGSISAGSTYTVQKGDTLFKIARERYGDASAWRKIAAANPGAGSVIKPGQKLVMP